MRELVERLDALCDAVPFHASWYLKDTATGARADRHGDMRVPSASTRKISIMMAALAAVHAGKLALDQRLVVEARYQSNESGTFQHLTPGFWVTLRDAIVMMIIVSDNTCTGMVTDLVGLSNLQRWCETVGMTATIHRYGVPPKLPADHTLEQVTTTTPNDQGLLLELILKGTGARGYMDAGILFKEDRPLCILTAFTDRVPAALPDGTPGFAAAAQLIGRMARACYDGLG